MSVFDPVVSDRYREFKCGKSFGSLAWVSSERGICTIERCFSCFRLAMCSIIFSEFTSLNGSRLTLRDFKFSKEVHTVFKPSSDIL